MGHWAYGIGLVGFVVGETTKQEGEENLPISCSLRPFTFLRLNNFDHYIKISNFLGFYPSSCGQSFEFKDFDFYTAA
ncbi:hypothetical protein [Kamptonema sp. UHCC 0994]|uniref:hypothetical protein n=1 Tax=Kamptonema sp. UHCC 0994 TaxID=3031329 RepID=UPI0023B8860D|nr:hypothetical protein [Kamptonema sp. UHCC 0994]MDF0554592.1 hypothetical protein [Kamptonema sp. UHCC 0994]